MLRPVACHSLLGAFIHSMDERRSSIPLAEIKDFEPGVERSDEPSQKQPLESGNEDHRCGFGSWRPPWLQVFASTFTYAIVHGCVGMFEFGTAEYMGGGSWTFEKHFKLSAFTMGLIVCAWEITGIIFTIPLSYLGSRGHQPRWLACGTLMMGLSAFVRMLPHFIYGVSEETLKLTYEYADNASLVLSDNLKFLSARTCGNSYRPEDCSKSTMLTSMPAVIVFVSCMMMGVGGCTYHTLGVAYLDDNSKKEKLPLLLGIVEALRMLGAPLGLLIASYTLSFFIEPSLTPIIDKEDPRWIGMYWPGYPFFSISLLIMAVILFMFPKTLQKGIQLNPTHESPKASLEDFVGVWRRIKSNRVLRYNTLSMVCFMIGATGGVGTKYIETQFGQSASRTSFIKGSSELIFSGFGIVAAAAVISWLKPTARSLAAWNVVTELLDTLGHVLWIFLSCPEMNLHGHWSPDKTWNLTETCNMHCDCDPNIPFSPICSSDGKTTFFSVCHASCTKQVTINQTSVYRNCSCVEDGIAYDGVCAQDCGNSFLIFVISICVMRILGASGRTANMLIQFRCVEEQDKALSVAITETALSAFVFLPAPIIYGYLTDMACIVWGQSCGETGNCWLYDGPLYRNISNLPSIVFLLLGTFFDTLVWYYAHDVKMFDEQTVVNYPNAIL